jgi:hypothetical protein
MGCGRVGMSSEALPFSSSTDMQPQQMPLVVYRMIGRDSRPVRKASAQSEEIETTLCSLGLKTTDLL